MPLGTAKASDSESSTTAGAEKWELWASGGWTRDEGPGDPCVLHGGLGSTPSEPPGVGDPLLELFTAIQYHTLRTRKCIPLDEAAY